MPTDATDLAEALARARESIENFPNHEPSAWLRVTDGAGLHAHRHGVDAGEVLEEHRLALHDGHRSQWSDVPEPEDRRAVADDGDGVASARVDVGQAGVEGDGARDVGCIAQAP